MIKYAKDYEALGFYLFPVSASKVPFAGFKWKDLSSKDAAQWGKWGALYPDCRWAIDCEKSGLSVIDIDPRNGGDITWEDLKQSFPIDIPETMQVKTPGGGIHIYFRGRYPKCKPWLGIDFQSIGSYVLCPPSERYEFITGLGLEAGIADLPAFLIPVSQPKKKFKVPEKLAEGSRNEMLFKFGCSLRGSGESNENIFEALKIANEKRCVPPLEEHEINVIIKSIGHYPPGRNEKNKVGGTLDFETMSFHEILAADLTEPLAQIYEKYNIAVGKKGPITNLDNTSRVLESLPQFKGLIWYDEFHKKILVRNRVGLQPLEWSDEFTPQLMLWFQRLFRMTNASEKTVEKAAIIFAHKNTRNEPRDWMDKLVWDGTSRIEHFFLDALGAEDSDYCRAASKNFFIGLAARIYNPGCKLDTMVVFEGDQGIGKSMALDFLGGKFFCETNESVNEKDFFQGLQGKFLVELAELDAFNRVEVNTIKKMLSCRTDRFRPSYGRFTKDYPRQCVFVGSTNEKTYLKDVTGGRRFWPIKVGFVDLQRIIEDRDELFAEARMRYLANEKWYEMPKESTLDAQEERREKDPWEDPIRHYLIGKNEIVLADIALNCLGIEIGKVDWVTSRRLGRVVTALNWKPISIKENGRTKRVWVMA